MPIEMHADELRAWLTLLRAPGLGAAGVRCLIERHGGAQAARTAALRDATLDRALRDALRTPDAEALARDEAWLAADTHHLLTFTHADFPSLLREIPDAPAALFVVGDVAALWTPQIAIVGARSASHAGLANARAFAKSFAQAGNTVTSGLAEGIDGAAHAAALDAGARTVAVLGTGPDLVYPRRHEALAQRIAAQGALVSEFPPGTPGKPDHFPRRNRLISGLSLGVLVVEAGLNSGSLITARCAAEQGRDVFALPGSIHNPLARGCHRLIREGARLVETAEEVLEGLAAIGAQLAEGLRARIAADETSATDAATGRAADPDYARLRGALEADPAALDVLALRTGLPAAALSSMLLMLELEGIVAVEAGGYRRR
jgi:DNA processing protein